MCIVVQLWKEREGWGWGGWRERGRGGEGEGGRFHCDRHTTHARGARNGARFGMKKKMKIGQEIHGLNNPTAVKVFLDEMLNLHRGQVP